MEYSLEINNNIISIILNESLIANRQYTIKLLADIKGNIDQNVVTLTEPFEFWFTSTYCPLFTSLTQVQMLLGPSAANAFMDDTIYRMIHKNSLDAVDIYNINNNTKIPYDYWGCTWHDVPYILRKYVECKTAYDILSILQQLENGLSGNSGQLKSLGDMTIRYMNRSGNNNSNDPNKKQELYDCWTELLRSIKTIKIAVKGWHDKSKGFAHPVREPEHNRVIRAIDFKNGEPNGPWKESRHWRGFK